MRDVEGGSDLKDFPLIGNECDDSHLALTVRTLQGINFIDAVEVRFRQGFIGTRPRPLGPRHSFSEGGHCVQVRVQVPGEGSLERESAWRALRAPYTVTIRSNGLSTRMVSEYDTTGVRETPWHRIHERARLRWCR